MAIKGQAIAEFTYTNAVEVAGTADNADVAKVAEAQGDKNSTFMKGDAAQWTF